MSVTRFASQPFLRTSLACLPSCVRTALALVTLFALPVVTGCGAVDRAEEGATQLLDQANEAAGNHDVTGTMPMRWKSSDGQSGPVRFVFSQDGLAVDGVVVFEDHPCLQELAVDAHVEVTGVVGDLVLDDFRLPFELSLIGSSGPKKPDGIVQGIETLACLAHEGTLQLESL